MAQGEWMDANMKAARATVIGVLVLCGVARASERTAEPSSAEPAPAHVAARRVEADPAKSPAADLLDPDPGDWRVPHSIRTRLPAISHWVCYYGKDRKAFALPNTDLLILDADQIGPAPAERPGKQVRLAYLSVGEAEKTNWFWKEVQGRPWLLHVNPAWPEGRLVDPRSREWKELLVERVARRLLDLGYDGFMLDTLDTARTLLEKDPRGFAGARGGMLDLVDALRARYPKAIVVANGGLYLFPDLATRVDGLVYEGVQSTYDMRKHRYRLLSAGEREWVVARLDAARAMGLPVLVLEYVEPSDLTLARQVATADREKGYTPFISVIQLDRLPTEVQP